jgi:hypothetical protein
LQPHPLDRLLPRPMIDKSLYARMVRLHIPMASHTQLHTGNTSRR